MNDFEKQLLSDLEERYQANRKDYPGGIDTVDEAIAAYKDLTEAVRSRIDSEMMEYSFLQAKHHQDRTEQIVKAAAPSISQTGGYAG